MCCLLVTASPLPAAEPLASYRPFFHRYCATCHDESDGKGGLDLESIELADVRPNAQVWEKVVHKLRMGDMPPPEELQPAKRKCGPL